MNCQDISRLLPLYLSGELAAAPEADEDCRAFVEHLAACPECAREVEQLTALDSRLREGVLSEDIDDTALDRRIRRDLAAQPQARTFRPAFAAAGIAAVLLLGGLGYRAWSTTAIPRMCTEAAHDHEREVIEGQPRIWLTDPAAIEALAARQGVPAQAVTALAPSNFRIERGKVCRLDGRLFLHLVYTDGAQEFSAFLRPREEQPAPGASSKTASESSNHAIPIGREHVGFFETQRLTAVVVTNQPGDAAERLTRFAASVL
jgi:anti-sigma factor RsiW